MEMKITVTQDHINNGKKVNPASCPIALAVKELGYSFVSVGNTKCHFGQVIDAGYRTFLLPEEAVEFVHAFDYNWPVNPFEFEMTTEIVE